MGRIWQRNLGNRLSRRTETNVVQSAENSPKQGLALLQTELKNESAAHRDELIQCLRWGLSKSDEAFLQEIVATDRSSNVKETARRLLCSLPDSELVKIYEELLRGNYISISFWDGRMIRLNLPLK